MIDIKAPTFPESIADGEIATWHVKPGQLVTRDEVLVDIETEKVVIEVVAPADGTIVELLKDVGDTVLAEEVLARFKEGAADSSAAATAIQAAVTEDKEPEVNASPAARKIAEEQRIDINEIKGTGRSGLITKEDVLKSVAELEKDEPTKPEQPRQTDTETVIETSRGGRIERRVAMTRLRASIAKRLVEAQQTAAMLTTFNEVDMQAIMDLRTRYKDDFEKAHNGTRLGFMSFFVRACIEALKRFPGVNASIDGNDIVYHGYQDIGVAVGSPRGLVVPVLREADSLTLAEIEDQIREFGKKARENKLSIEDMSGGTFTISNGGVFGSLLSTPILNPPQTGILGMHKIQERPMAVNGQVVIRPMMYLALSYDHRLIDGQEAVRFLVTIKDFLEEPARILLDI